MNIAVSGLDTLRDWLLEKNPDLDSIDDDLDLFESKLIDSINFVEFILIIEELIDREIPVSNDLVAKTSTLRLVYQHYLSSP
jgi:acyl carrier protein